MIEAKNVANGINLILQYEEDAVFTSEHETIWCGQGNGKSVTEITPEGKAILEGMGWHIDEDMKCWSKLI